MTDETRYVAPTAGALSNIPFAVLVKHGAPPKEIHDFLRLTWPLRPTHTYRYLQVWKQKGHLTHTIDKKGWQLTPVGKSTLLKRFDEGGWPRWLEELGYEPDELLKNPVKSVDQLNREAANKNDS